MGNYKGSHRPVLQFAGRFTAKMLNVNQWEHFDGVEKQSFDSNHDNLNEKKQRLMWTSETKYHKESRTREVNYSRSQEFEKSRIPEVKKSRNQEIKNSRIQEVKKSRSHEVNKS